MCASFLEDSYLMGWSWLCCKECPCSTFSRMGWPWVLLRPNLFISISISCQHVLPPMLQGWKALVSQWVPKPEIWVHLWTISPFEFFHHQILLVLLPGIFAQIIYSLSSSIVTTLDQNTTISWLKYWGRLLKLLAASIPTSSET